jgi:hypothetical protein
MYNLLVSPTVQHYCSHARVLPNSRSAADWISQRSVFTENWQTTICIVLESYWKLSFLKKSYWKLSSELLFGKNVLYTVHRSGPTLDLTCVVVFHPGHYCVLDWSMHMVGQRSASQDPSRVERLLPTFFLVKFHKTTH